MSVTRLIVSLIFGVLLGSFGTLVYNARSTVDKAHVVLRYLQHDPFTFTSAKDYIDNCVGGAAFISTYNAEDIVDIATTAARGQACRSFLDASIQSLVQQGKKCSNMDEAEDMADQFLRDKGVNERAAGLSAVTYALISSGACAD